MTYQNIPIEAWFIELFDGTLSEEVTHEFLAFCLINNIDVPEDLTTLMPSDAFLQTKDILRFPAHESILNDPKQDYLKKSFGSSFVKSFCSIKISEFSVNLCHL